jgi:hypothetical protein
MAVYGSVRQHMHTGYALLKRSRTLHTKHMTAYGSKRQHTSAYVSICILAYGSIRQHMPHWLCAPPAQPHAAYGSIRQHTSACVSICQHVQHSLCAPPAQPHAAYVSIRQHTSACATLHLQSGTKFNTRYALLQRSRMLHSEAYGSIRKHTSAYVSMCTLAMRSSSAAAR